MAKRKIALAGAMAAMLLVTACSGGGGNTGNGTSNTGGASTGGANDGGGERPTISIMTPLHLAETPDAKIEEMIEDKLNVDLEIQWIPASTFQDRMTSAFATGSLTDIVNIRLDGANREAIQDGQFWEVGPYLDEYENLSKLQEEVLNNTMVDGKLYALYQGRPLSRQGLIYRADWAENLGLATPQTLDELYEMMKQFTENDPDGNGQDDTVGLADRNDFGSGAFKTVGSWIGMPNEWGMQDGQLRPAFMFPEYKETMDFIKDLRDNGYMNSDFPVTSKTEQQNMLINGEAGTYIGCMCDVQQLYTGASQLNPDAAFDVQNQITTDGEPFTVWSGPGFNHPYLFPKSAVKTEEELKQILAFMDGLMDPEIANLLYWGIEGEHYTIEDGLAVPVADQGKIDREVKPYNTIEVGDPATSGRLAGKYEYAPMQKAQELFDDNANYAVQDPTLTLSSETYTDNKDRLAQIITDATYNYMLGELDEAGFDQAVARWQSEGGDQVIEEFNASYADSQ
ncbi:extracellular solute-binding protein [Paenibacillus sp. IB182496]|uniref:Extracellular solute-binding protein n=1 Tax=Paenibacillus sabuli TaxID=2772509 RepID=A0A927BQF1_9BACL|nr:extracellular solute-binding protein [Paenibacillus sabuli]MBD2843649.1 extracellular solute-binding protein [Paenibacillus sabuli]